ncbi:MAG: hypothetical protein C0459_12235 [Chitinophaga sp.]|nr:hypothetical protein [Chitinophaga sp.]
MGICIYACKSSNKSDASSTLFNYEVTIDKDLTNLPALQSFCFGTTTSDSGKYWLMFGGRTNGFHGFGGQENFPVKKANTYMYVFNTKTNSLDSIDVSYLPKDLREQYISTNMQNRQVDSFLYVCGGYGAKKVLLDTLWVTHNIISRININQIVKAILAKDSIGIRKAIAYDKNDFLKATGGELYKMPDGKFYLLVGHNFKGRYADTNKLSLNYAVQTYLDAVHVFSLIETPTSVTLDTKSFQTITDGLVDTLTQFRRRDLNIVPSVLPNGKYGITIYGGVFTYASGRPGFSGGNPFRNPIYIYPDSSNPYKIDSKFRQLWNVYSAPNFTMFDSLNNGMLTTIFGGLGDTLASNIGPSNNLPNGPDSAAFTKFITTLFYNNTSGNTTPIFSQNPMPHYVGAEGVFIQASNLPIYKNNSLGIVNYDQIPVGKTFVGYIYGGIHSDSTQWNNVVTKDTINNTILPLNITYPSNKVYKVYLTKAATDKK